MIRKMVAVSKFCYVKLVLQKFSHDKMQISYVLHTYGKIEHILYLSYETSIEGCSHEQSIRTIIAEKINTFYELTIYLYNLFS